MLLPCLSTYRPGRALQRAQPNAPGIEGRRRICDCDEENLVIEVLFAADKSQEQPMLTYINAAGACLEWPVCTMKAHLHPAFAQLR